MSIRSFLMLIWAVLVSFCGIGCTRVEKRAQTAEPDDPPRAGARASQPRAQASSEEQETATSGRPATPDRAMRAAAGGRSASTPEASEDSATPELPVATISACESATVQAPLTECFEYDDTEPNDKASPALIPIDPSCGYLEANISAGDDDAFSFTTLRSDPVLIELSYLGTGEADLEQAVYGSTGNLLEDQRKTRVGAGEDLRSVIQSAANGNYVVRVKDSRDSDSCQSYALRVDPLYCGDAHEDNDSLQAAKKLSWDFNERVTLAGALLESDEDFFEVTTPRGDPVQLTGFYAASPGSTAQVSRAAFDGAGSLQFNTAGAREGDMESFSHWLTAPAKGSVLRTRLRASGSGCATYELTLDAAACTDDYEDNDNSMEAATLDLGRDSEVTLHGSDEDHYAFAPVNAGSCSVTYDIPDGRSQQLHLAVYDGAGSLVDSDSGGELSGTVRSMKASWADHDVIRVRVRGSSEGYCQPYTLRCDAAMGQ